MDVLERSIQVTFRHRVIFTRGVFDPANPVLRDLLVPSAPPGPARALVVVDEALATAQPALFSTIAAYFAAHPAAIELAGPPLRLAGGEPAKNSDGALARVHAGIERHGIDRQSYVIGVGGGALLDMVGLAAATAHRGCRHVRVPTTTLSQADSGVGLKNAINAFGKKNFIGTFTPPFAVLNDFDLLATLSPRDRRAGYAEAVKVALIRDRAFFDAIEADAACLAGFDDAAIERLIRRSAELHLDHIAKSGDPFESGSARPLDFGHWSAHALEQLSGFRLRHGEAVAIGLAIDTLYSQRAGYLQAADARRVLDLLERLGFVLFAPELLEPGADGRLKILGGLEEFRAHLGGPLTVTLLRGLGAGFEVHAIDPALVAAAVRDLQARHARQPSRP